MEREEIYSVPELKRRGWTPSLIKKFMPQEDDIPSQFGGEAHILCFVGNI